MPAWTKFLPRILIIDDLFGRSVPDQGNIHRRDLCGQFLVVDETGDDPLAADQHVHSPVARATFCRGQTPIAAKVGDVVCNSIAVVLEAVARGWGPDVLPRDRWSLVLVDLCFYTGAVTATSHEKELGMPVGSPSDDSLDGYFGLEVLRALRKHYPLVPAAVFSSKPRADVAREFSDAGAVAFLPRDADDPPNSLRSLLKQHGLIPDELGLIVGEDPALLRALRSARRAGAGRGHVLLLGERGSGKDLFARFIHRAWSKGGNFVALDCGTLSTEIYASEIFGHERGAFTGAVAAREGAIERADGGDLFLDEIGNMPADIQASLLRVLETGEVRKLGGNAARRVDVRVIAATNADLPALAAVGRFRADLLDRLSAGATISVPTLRARSSDIPKLASSFVREAEIIYKGARRRSITAETMQVLRSHSWPGNVRELRACILAAVRDFPDLEFIAPTHLGRIAAQDDLAVQAGTQQAVQVPSPVMAPEGLWHRTDSPAELAAVLTQTRPADWTAQELLGVVPRLQIAFGGLLLDVLRAGLEATRRHTIERPGGQYYLQPTMKLLTGDESLTTVRAADVVKRLLAASGVDPKTLPADDPLRLVAERSLRLRSAGRRKALK